MKIVIAISTLFLSFMITGCGEETKSRVWWSEHIEQAKEKDIECKKSGADTDNCRNAREAVFRYDQAHAPIMKFDTDPEKDKEEWESFKKEAEKNKIN
ncbi:addiction module [Arsenophonus sp. ENCA]|uniref:EexN family lipoprotein n=1 Tax=Arsenophonus sp. ENCA TaxID=1987579 RepID=UPI000BD333F4|nr:EexN family lipoprotein [Arsenophonus sp. ENCA]PAV05649.1 addiction module [Arsenophonus sp. ENCA]